MPAIFTFDGVNRRMTEINTGLSVNEVDYTEIYSEWKEWVATSPANAGIVQAIRYSGAEPISAIQNTGTTFFQLNGWKVVPADYNHRLVINGNVFTDPAGLDRTDFTTITANGIEVVWTVSNLVDSSVARLDLAQLQEAVFIDTFNGVSGTAVGIGTPTNPSSNIGDATFIALRDNLRSFCIIGPVTLAQSYMDWKFIGTISKESGSLDFGGFTHTRCAFEKLGLSGDANGSSISVDSCKVASVMNALGTFSNTGFSSLFSPGVSGVLTLDKCFSDVPGSGKPIIDLADNLSDDLQVRGWHGGLELRNVDVSGQKVSIDMDAGHLIVDSTCIAGEILVRGNGKLTNNAIPQSIVDDTGFNERLGGAF